MMKNRKETTKSPLSFLQRFIKKPKIHPAKRARMSGKFSKNFGNCINNLTSTNDEDSDVEIVSVSMPRGLAKVPTDFEILNIFHDISNLEKIEKYLNILYRPFVCFVNTKCEYNLRELDLLLPSAKYDSDRHSALIINRTHPICSLKVYANGNIYAQGFSQESASCGLKKFLSHIEEFDYKPVMHNPKFNVVNATFSMPFHVNLYQMHLGCNPRTIYNSEKAFLTYWMGDWDIKFAIFPTGFVYVMLSTQPRTTRRAIKFILPLLYRYKQVQTKPIELFNNGDIDYKLQWEREFQREDDFSIIL